MSEYEYTPLAAQSNIRLLRLLPKVKSQHGELCGELVEYKVQSYDDRAHPYEALSYCWETSEKPRELNFDRAVLAITENLHAALLQLRYDDFDRLLWIDAVCIDQSNDSEKELQVPLIGEIYAKARTVLVWLGPGDDESVDALEAIRCAAAGTEDAALSQTVQASVHWLLQKPWFERMWASVQRTGSKPTH